MALEAKARNPKAYTTLDEFDKATILEMIDTGSSIEAVSNKLDKHPSTIYRFLRGMRDTTRLAERYIKAKALVLAERIVDRADVDQAIDLLSRANLGVIAPAKSVNSGPQVLISVDRESCSAVVEGEVLPNANDKALEVRDARTLPSDQEEPALIRQVREYSGEDSGGYLQQDEEAGGEADGTELPQVEVEVQPIAELGTKIASAVSFIEGPPAKGAGARRNGKVPRK